MKHQWFMGVDYGPDHPEQVVMCEGCGVYQTETNKNEECSPSTAELVINPEEILPSRY